MKRLIQILAVIALGVLITWGVIGILDRTEKRDLTELKNGEDFSSMPVNYLPVMPFNGPDFTTAAEKTVHGVVHIRSEFTRKSSSYDYYVGKEIFEI